MPLPLFIGSGQFVDICSVDSAPLNIPGLVFVSRASSFQSHGDIGSLPRANDTRSWFSLDDFWARFVDQSTRATSALEHTSPDPIPLILENPDIFGVEPTDHDTEGSLHQTQSLPSAVLDQVFAQMATDMDDFGDDVRE